MTTSVVLDLPTEMRVSVLRSVGALAGEKTTVPSPAAGEGGQKVGRKSRSVFGRAPAGRPVRC